MFSFFRRRRKEEKQDESIQPLKRPAQAEPTPSQPTESDSDVGAIEQTDKPSQGPSTHTETAKTATDEGITDAAEHAAAGVTESAAAGVTEDATESAVEGVVEGAAEAAVEDVIEDAAPAAATTDAGTKNALADDAVTQEGPIIEQAEVAPEPAMADSPQSAAPAQDKAKKKEKRSWFGRLRAGLARTGQNLSGLFVGAKVDEELFEELETALIMADAGIEATESLLADLRARVRKERLTDAAQVKEALIEILSAHLAPLEKAFPLRAHQPLVVMIAGVNGAGKTTSIGKLAQAFQAQQASVLLAAGDTFRAAAREQLIEWGQRNNVTVIAQDGGDPAAVAFDAVNAARARDIDVVMVDTAGRLPTQLHLMDELKKIHRVVGRAYEGAPHEVLLVVDGNTGQNALAQIRAFDAAIPLSGLIVTKLDGTAKGGILAAVAAGSQQVRPVPVYWIGVGEGLYDLQPFVAQEFAQALLADD